MHAILKSAAFATAALLSTSLFAQTLVPIGPETGTYTGYSRGWSTQAQTAFLITNLSLATGSSQTGPVECYLVLVNGVQVHHTDSLAQATGGVAVSIPVLPGDDVIVLGHFSNDPWTNFGAANSYASGGGSYTVPIEGVTHTLFRAGWQWNIGDPNYASNNSSFSGNSGSMGRVEITTQPLAGTIGVSQSYGNGCSDKFENLLEEIPAASFDLDGQVITGLSLGAMPGTGYLVTTQPGTLDPVGTIGTPSLLTLSDDGFVAAGTLGCEVGSNGWLAVGSGHSTSFNPTIALAVSGNFAVHAWTDLQPNTSGTTEYEEDVATGVARVTFTQVALWNTPNLVDIQLTLNTVTGNYTIAFGATIGTGSPSDWVVGHTTATGGVCPSSDISSFTPANPALVEAADEIALTLVADQRPVQVNGGPVQLTATTDNIGTTDWHVGFIGFTQPQVSLGAVGGPSDCFLNSSLDLIVDVDVPTAAGSRQWNVLVLPNLAVNDVTGFTFNIQAATFGPAVLDSGTRTSNGVSYLVGDI